jgi:hypothetical protein
LASELHATRARTHIPAGALRTKTDTYTGIKTGSCEGMITDSIE